MNSHNPNISSDTALPIIRQLDEAIINRIAAGEVVERPASAVKELVENAIDAGASRIEILQADGGKTLIQVSDDGCGIPPQQLPLALTRHATSKIDGSDLLDIRSFGFRGEALASLAAVGRLSIETKAEGHEATEIRAEGGHQHAPRPAARGPGTTVTLRDLFYATPARLKFLRTERAEAQAILDVVKRLAMAEPAVGFTLRDMSGGGSGRVTFRADPEAGDLFDALRKRLAVVLGKEFAANALPIDATREDIHLTGYAALPTYSRGAAVAQFIYVNGRPVRDKLLLGALRAAYMDVLSRDRHPAACLFITVDPQRVDVNVHPAKSEVRFREPAIVRGLIVSGLRHALAEAGHRASSTVGQDTLSAFRTPARPGAELGTHWQAPPDAETPRVYQMDRTSHGRASGFAAPAAQPILPGATPAQQDASHTDPLAGAISARSDVPAADPQDIARPLGAARAQLHGCYIVSQTETGMILVDMHAAHERLVYEKLKAARGRNGVPAQALLIPDIVELGSGADVLLALAEPLAALGLGIEPFGPGAVAVRETPAILGQVDTTGLLKDICDELSDLGDSGLLESRIDAVLSRMACHGSIRSGREMRAEEMNALLREMEATPLSGQCNHGRPTYVSLELADIERLFGRA